MNILVDNRVSRRTVLTGGGALVLSFSMLSSRAFAQKEEAEVAQQGDELPGSLSKYPFLDSWIRIDADESITVFTGKAELGQGMETAILQIAAEQLEVEMPRIEVVTADTARTPNEGFTASSHSMEESGMAILNAAAQVRRILVELAAERLGVPAEKLSVENGVVTAKDGQELSYGTLVSDQLLHVRANPESQLLDPGAYTIMGKPVPRIDIPPKLTGEPIYVQDLRLPGMVHARVVRPPVYGATLQSVDTSAVEAMPGVLEVVRDGSYLAVVAEREYQAIRAMAALEAAAEWGGGVTLPKESEIYSVLQSLDSQDSVLVEQGNGPSTTEGLRTVEAVYRRPYQMHASMGPSCAVGLYEDDQLTVWSHTQGVYPDRKAIAQMVGMPEESVRVIHMDGAGCYGHNGADDAAADAALIARTVPGRPVRIQWMREQENLWEPYGSAMVVSAKASVDKQGEIADWNYEVWSTPHTTRPGPAGNLMPSWFLSKPFQPEDPFNIPLPSGGAERNSVPPYKLPNARVVEHFIPTMPLRVSALRSLGAYTNVFAVESLMDELATLAGADPVDFRLARLDDPRARDVISKAADEFGWSGWERSQPGRGHGFAYGRYKGLAAYCAVAMEVEVEQETGRIQVIRAVAASDSGQVVNPNGIQNQIEGGIVQSISWTLFEQVRYSESEILSKDWASYPILRFPSAPHDVAVHVIDRPGSPFLGTGEAAQGPAAAAIANAVADATGVRIRELPLTRERVMAALA